MKVLVAGGAGFIGSHLCEKLLEQGSSVICLDNLLTGSKNNIESLIPNPNFTFVEFDITQKIDNISSNLDQIYQMASPASPVDYTKYSTETMLVNSVGTYNLLNLAKEKGAKLLLASTSEVYGDPKEHPQKETYFGNVNPIGPRSVYDEAKRFAEALTMDFVRTKSLEGVIVRIFNTYGPKMQIGDGRVVPNFILQALKGEPLTVYGDGSQTRSFCFVQDLVAGLLTVMEKGRVGEVYNLGNPEEYKIIDFARIIKEKVGSSSEVIFKEIGQDDPKQRRPDITKVSQLGWEPKVSLDGGLRDTIDYFKNLVK